MAPHLAPRFVRLRDAAGNADDAAFMRFKQELWNEDRTRLTLLMDPSRIKRGVASGLQAEPALVEGRRYALSVDAGWPSADGSSVLPAFAKRFVATAALRERPEVTRWSWTSPRPGTRDALTVTFDRPFDRHLLRHALHVATNDGRAVAGTSSVGERETSWSFVPDASWVTSQVRITVAKALEDVAGNSFLELLDRDLSPAGSS